MTQKQQLFWHHTIASVLGLFLLASCSTIPPSPGQVNMSAQLEALEQLQHWQIKGRMAFKSSEESFSANLNWRQTEDQYALKLNSFIGTSILDMQGDNSGVRLEVDDNHYEDADASLLIWRITGWNIPVDHMPVWVKGLAFEQDDAEYNANSLLEVLRPNCFGCMQWRIQYANYQAVKPPTSKHPIWLPYHITLSNQLRTDNKIIIRVSEWNLN